MFIDYTLVATFAHYRPLSSVSHLYINGDIELASVSWEGKYYVRGCSVMLIDLTSLSESSLLSWDSRQSLSRKKTSRVGNIQSWWYDRFHLGINWGIYSEERKIKPSSFYIDLLSGTNCALHFEPVLARKVRFLIEWTFWLIPIEKVVRTSCMGGVWSEEQVCYFLDGHPSNSIIFRFHRKVVFHSRKQEVISSMLSLLAMRINSRFVL